MTFTIFIQSVLFIALIYFVVSAIGMLNVKSRLEKNSARYKDQQIEPSGSALRHGMVRSTSGRGVERDSTPSLTWYSRLL